MGLGHFPASDLTIRMSANQVLGVMRILQGPAADEAIDKGVLRWKLSKFSQCPGWGPHLSQWCKLRHLARVSPAHGAAIVEGERDESSIDPAAGKSGFCAQGNHLRACSSRLLYVAAACSASFSRERLCVTIVSTVQFHLNEHGGVARMLLAEQKRRLVTIKREFNICLGGQAGLNSILQQVFRHD